MAKPKKRERIGSRGPFITIANHRTLLLWRDVYGVPLGHSLDAIIEYARNSPNFKLPVKNARNCLMAKGPNSESVQQLDTKK